VAAYLPNWSSGSGRQRGTSAAARFTVAAHQIRGMETLAFRPGRKRRSLCSGMSVQCGTFQLFAISKRACSFRPRQGMPWPRGEASGMPGL
jgi:hypothetical protein